MKTVDRNAVLEMEEDIFDVSDWGEAVHMAAHAIADEHQRAAFAKMGSTIARLGETLRFKWCAVAGLDQAGVR